MLPSAGDLFTLEPSKSQAQQIRIIEATITSYAEKGIEATTYANLARDCEISRTLIHHYFPTLDSLFLLAARYARQTLLKLAREGIENSGAEPDKQLRGYIAGCFRWVELFPNQVRFWMLYFYQASRGGEALKENTELVSLGHARIQALIQEGQARDLWKVSDVATTAKAIQVLITGGIVSAISEQGYLSETDVSSLITDAAFDLLKR